MARERPGSGEHHAEGAVGHSAPEFRVDEVADAAEEQPGGHQRGHEVEDIYQSFPVAASPQPAHQHHADESAMERHAAMPQAHYLQRIGEEGGGLVKERVAEPGTEDDADELMPVASSRNDDIVARRCDPARFQAVQAVGQTGSYPRSGY